MAFCTAIATVHFRNDFYHPRMKPTSLSLLPTSSLLVTFFPHDKILNRSNSRQNVSF